VNYGGIVVTANRHLTDDGVLLLSESEAGESATKFV